MRDASIQETMGAIQDRTMEHLCAADAGIIMTRKMMLRAAKAAAEGKPGPASDPQAQRVRSVAIELAQGTSFTQGAKHGLYAELGTEPLSV
jgi:phthalate 4,5-dioxygenase oxygenase subunit